jgi:hypothetical protein
MKIEFALVTTPFQMQCPLPTELVPGHFLRRATDAEIDRMRGSSPFQAAFPPYRLQFESGCFPDRGFIQLAHDEWMYFVIEVRDLSTFQAVNDGLLAITDAASLTETELRCSIYFNADGGCGWSRYLGEFDDPVALHRLVPTFTQGEALMITATHQQLVAIDKERYKSVVRALQMLAQLRNVWSRHELQVLGLFAIIESLLTHDPKGDYDSLGHQIRTKMALLSQRFEHPIVYSAFGNMQPDKLWKKLYECRSAIAHGGGLNFVGPLKSLGDMNNVREFLRRVTKQLLRFSLVEPQLVLDLQSC